MSKEPNGTLVMTTCKCRENNSNLVMTRTYFNEMLENKIAWGAEQERKRIIELLENTRSSFGLEYKGVDINELWLEILPWLVTTIKGEN